MQELVARLPADLPAAVFVAMHIPAYRQSLLPQILSRHGRLPAIHPESGEPIERGHIYVAPPDFHLVLEDASIRLWRGPKENRARPSINVLFRSAALTYKSRVIGVVLTGNLDDGSLGLWWVKHFGGIAIVQDPEDAAFYDMPRNALNHVNADYVARLPEIGPLLVELTDGAGPPAIKTEDQPQWKPKSS